MPQFFQTNLLLARPKEFQWIEFFSGSRMATKCVAGAGYRATCVDLSDYVKAGYALGEGTVFDINSPSGFVPLSKEWWVMFATYSWLCWLFFCLNKLHQSIPASQSRLSIQALLQSDPQGFVVWLGILCATWSAVSRGSTFRWYLNPLGLEERPCVASGNLMVSRCGVPVVLVFNTPIKCLFLMVSVPYPQIISYK